MKERALETKQLYIQGSFYFCKWILNNFYKLFQNVCRYLKKRYNEIKKTNQSRKTTVKNNTYFKTSV